MQIVIKIDEEQYEFIKQSMTMDKIKDYPALLYVICEHIKNGTPLPKGHGRLVEVRAVIKALFDKNTIYDVPTIIEADKPESEGKSCSNCKYWLLDKNNENRRCKYCFKMDKWAAEIEDKK